MILLLVSYTVHARCLRLDHRLIIMKYADIIHHTAKLKIDQELHPTHHIITIYQPTAELTRDELETQLKSSLIQLFREEELLQEYPQVPHHLLQLILEKLYQSQDSHRGIMTAIKFNPAELNRASDKDRHQLVEQQFYRLQRKPSASIELCQTVDLTQLYLLMKNDVEALAVTVEKKRAKIYLYTLSGLEHLETIENQYLTMPDERLLQRYTATANKQVSHGYGESNIQRREEQAIHYQFLDIEKKLDELADEYEIEQLVFLVSEALVKSYQKWMGPQRIEQWNLQEEPILVKKLVKNDQELYQSVREALEKYARGEIVQRYRKFKEDAYHQFVSGWEKVTEAIREYRVEELFIKPDATYEGYIYQSHLPYTYSVRESVPVKNLRPWLVRVVADTGGIVVPVTEQDKDLVKDEIAATLRYA